MSAEPIVFGQPSFDQSEIDLVTEVIRSGWIGQGPLVQRFERELAEYVGASHVVSVNSCTAALELSLRAIGLGLGDEVITTPLTFVATVNAIEATGATPRLVDIDPNTLLITPQAVESAISARTRAVVPVSFAGRGLDLAGFLQLADAHDLWIVEDAAHSVGGVAGGLPIGADRHPRLLTCFSFYPNKNLASAEGGAVALQDDALADLIRSLRLHGLDVDAWQRYRSNAFNPSLAVNVGFKANWTDVQAAIAIPQLAKLEGFQATREFLASGYDERLSGIAGVRLIDRPTTSLSERHALHLYQVRVVAERRNEIVEGLRSEGIGAAVHYVAVNFHPRFDGHFDEAVPNSDLASGELISLPLHPGMCLSDLDRIAEALARLINQRRVQDGD